MILRIVFKSGRVVEERGDLLMCAALYERDTDELIDYILTMEMASNEVAAVHAEGDHRFDDLEILYATDLIKRG